jgi:hypothetical protein
MELVKIKQIYNGFFVKIDGDVFYFEYSEMATKFIDFYIESNQGDCGYSPDQIYDIWRDNPSDSTIELRKTLDKKYQSIW